MRLDFNNSGRQFFFITLTVAGRKAILSRLVDEKTRPVLTEIGEVVKAALLALHLVNEAVALSDFIIMPDHFHFILVVDYGRDRTASPLYLAHRLLDAVEGYLEWTGLRTPLLWEQLSRANRVRFCPSAFRVAMALQLIDASLPKTLCLKKASCVSLLSAIRSLRRACTVQSVFRGAI